MVRKIFGDKRNQTETAQSGDNFRETEIAPDLETNVQAMKDIFADCSDIIFRSFMVGGSVKAVVIFTRLLSNTEGIFKALIRPLMHQQIETVDVQEIFETKLPVSSYIEIHSYDQAAENVLTGNPVIFFDGQTACFSVNLERWQNRPIEEPTSESVVRGPREGFTESIEVNTSLLRRKIRNPGLKMKPLTIGSQTKTMVMLVYMEGLVDPALLKEVTNRLQSIKIDGLLESSYIEEFIEDRPFSPFPQMINTERPDVAAANLLEGRVVILTDGTPFAIVLPANFNSLLQSPEDYYQRFMISTLIRWLRFGFLGMALLLPSVYVAILTFHQEMIPTTLLISIAESREEIPFPALVEALLMEITFEILREAGIRLPKQIGSAVSIVGALVIGQAAVSAGLVSAPMVMVVAATGIASFAVPRYNTAIAIRMLRFPIILLAGTLGLLGVMLGLIAVIVHMGSISSFGHPYLLPMSPLKKANIKDFLIRAPWWSLRKSSRYSGDDHSLGQTSGKHPDPLSKAKQEV
jgi:spore germination protein KA